ncbi:MAG: PAS domain S-box protein, partial [Anaerolineales bacterium]
MTDRTTTPYAKLVAELADCENALRQSRQRNANIEAGLRLTADHLRLAFQNSPMPVFHQDKDLRYTWVYNPAFESGPSILGKTDEDLMPPAEAQTLIATKRRVLQSGLPERVEIRQWIEGREWWFDVSLAVRRDADGYIEGLSGVAVDVTDRKRAEEALRQSEERLMLIARATNDALYDWDFRTGRAWSNDAFVKQFGNHPTDVESDMRDWLERVHPDEQDRMQRGMEAALNGDSETWTDEYHFRRMDGSYAFVFDRAHIVRDAQGKAIRVVGAMLDLSERKQVEEALRASEEKFARAFGLGPIVLCLTSLADGRMLDVNESLLKFTGHTRAEVIGRTPVEMGWWASPEMREHGLAVMRREGQILNQEMVFRLKSSEERTCLVSGEIIDISGQRCVLTALVDITERKQAEERLHMLADLNEKMRASKDAPELLFTAAQAVGEHLQVRRAFFVEIDLANNRGKVHRDYHRGVPSVAIEYALTDYSTITLEEVKAGRTVVNYDSQTDPRTAAIYETGYRPNGERAYVAVPLMREGVWVSALWVSDDQPRPWSAEEVALLETVAQRAWLAVENIRLFKETNNALAALRESEERFRLLADSAPVLIWINGLQGCEFVNREYLDFLGVSDVDVRGYDWAQFIHPEDREGYVGVYLDAVSQRALFEAQFRFRHHTGEYRWMKSTGTPRFSTGGEFLGYAGSTVDIHDIKLAEASLRESERRHRSTFENAAVGIAHFGMDGSFLHVNARQCEMLGYTREELLATTWQAISHPAEIALNLELRERHIRGETESYSLEKRYFHKHGPVVWVNLTASLRRDENGEPLYFVAFIEDISERKRAEEALRTSEERLRLALEGGSLGTWQRDLRTDRVMWDARTNRILGLPENAEQNADTFFSAVHPDDRPKLHATRERALKLRQGFEDEIRITHPDGRLAWALIKAKPDFGDDSQPIRLTGVCLDISALKQAETRLRESQQRLALALESGRMGVWDWELTSGRQHWSPEQDRLFGFEPGEGEYNQARFFNLVHPEDKARIIAKADQAAARGEDYVEDEFRVIRPDGVVRWIASRSRLQRDATGRAARMVGVNMDVTERKQAEDVLR